MKAIAVQWNVVEVLAEASVEGNALTFKQEYDRTIYAETKKVLEAIGGKWDRYANAFLFPGDAAGVIGEIVQSGQVTRVVPPGEPANEALPEPKNVIALAEFVADFGEGLMQAVLAQNPPVYDGVADARCEAVMDGLKRQPFPAQLDLVQAVAKLLLDADEKAAIANGEMGCGKTMVAICLAAVLRAEGYRRTLVICPPHLVYKWRREILETVPKARVWVLNGPDTLRQLLALRANRHDPATDAAEFFVLGRVRMRMGFEWKPVAQIRKRHERRYTEAGNEQSLAYVETRVCGLSRLRPSGGGRGRRVDGVCQVHRGTRQRAAPPMPALRNRAVEPETPRPSQRPSRHRQRRLVPDADHRPENRRQAAGRLRGRQLGRDARRQSVRRDQPDGRRRRAGV
jgi:hypothetical protein